MAHLTAVVVMLPFVALQSVEDALARFEDNRKSIQCELRELNEKESGRHLRAGQDPSRLKAILSMERDEYHYRIKRVAYLAELSRFNQVLVESHKKLSASISEDPVILKGAIEDLRVSVFADSQIWELPQWLAERASQLLKDLSSRCTHSYGRWADPRSGKLEPLLHGALKIWQLANGHDDVGLELDGRELGEESSWLKLPSHLISLSREVDEMLVRAKVSLGESGVDKIFGFFCSSVHTLFKAKLVTIVNQRLPTISSSSPGLGLRLLAEFLVEVQAELHRLWILTCLMFDSSGKRAERLSSSQQNSSTLLDMLFAANYHGVASSRLLNFSQMICQTVNAVLSNALKVLLKKSHQAPQAGLEFAINLLAIMYSHYGNPLGQLHMNMLALRRERGLSDLEAQMIEALSEQPPLGEVISFVLKSIKGTSPELQEEVLVSQLWKGDNAANKLRELYNHCSLVAALSSYTSSRTNSKQILSDFLMLALNSGKEKGSHARVATQKLVRLLSAEEERKAEERASPLLGLVEASNVFDLLAHRFYSQHMPTIPSILLELASSSSPTQKPTANKQPTKSLAKFV